MYNKSYAIIAQESPQHYRRVERALLEQAIDELRSACIHGSMSVEMFKATARLRRIWSALISDLSNENNALPDELRASLISIGIWIQKELDKIDAGKSDNYSGIIEINQIIVNGLG
jgi:flagellar protein FlaF